MSENDCSVGNEGISIIMLKVIPGKEQETLQEIREKNVSGLVYQGFGKYDIILVLESKRFEKLQDYSKLPYVIDWNVIYGFKWLPKKTSEVKIAGKKILGICCLKMDYRLITKIGISKEQEIVSSIYSRFASNTDARNVVMLGGIGFYDVVCMIETENYGQLHDIIQRILEITKGEDHTILVDTLTIPCVRFDVVLKENCLVGEHELAQVFPESVKASILVDFYPGSEKIIFDQLVELFGSHVTILFGEHDFLVSNFELQLGKLLHRILMLRKHEKLVGRMSETVTIMKGNFQGKGFTKPPLPGEPDKEVLLWDEKLDSWQESSNEFVSHAAFELSHILHLYMRMKKDVVTTCVFRNLKALLKPIFDEIQCIVAGKEVIEEKLFNIHEAFTEMRFAFSQRYSGIEAPYLFGIRSSNIEEFGGINRLILAAEAVPLSLMNCAKLNWEGFLIFGYVPEPRRFDYGVMNLPASMLFSPEYWHSLFHEVGHEAYSQVVNNLPKKQQDELNEKMVDSRVEDKKTQHRFLWEIFSDMFDFTYGFESNWELYLKSLWTYLLRGAKELKEINMNLLQRTFVLYLSVGPRKDLVGQLDDIIVIEKAASEFISNFIEILRFDRVEIDVGLVVKDLIYGVGYLKNGINELLLLLPSHTREKDNPNVEFCLRNGTVMKNVNPVLIIRTLSAMRQNHECCFRERLTAVACLLDYAIRHADY